MAEQNQNPVASGDPTGVSKGWLARSLTWIRESLMFTKDPILEELAERRRRQEAGEEILQTPEENAQWVKEERKRLDALSRKFEERLKR